MADIKKVGWIGTGVMGSSMAGHLADKGFQMQVYTRTKAKAQALLDKGATWAESPAKAAEGADIVFAIVGFPKDVEEVFLGGNGVLAGLGKGGICCDMTTSSPALAARIAEEAQRKGCVSLDAPVTGGDVGARNATLSIFVGGDAAAFEKAKPCFEAMGKKLMHCGAPGTGQKAKLANQVAVAGVMFSVCESLLFAQEAGLDVAQWLELVAAGAAGSAAMNGLGRRMLIRDFKPGFFIDHFVKDLGLCLEECRRMGIVLPATTLAESFYRMLQLRNRGSDGTQAVIEVLAELSNKKWKEHK
ncbi:MAG: NAD(P)-dependent oxidoreductase [Desulfovibrio sp.]|jgi:3-hydroxyisobutyrate dehydrogenase|nr:NAD(P)-dependent oxidoreductase [Desulfovibrio sp.]